MVDNSTVLNFDAAPMRIAFGIQGYLDKELKNDEHYVKTFTRLYYLRDGEYGETMIPNRRCRKEDYDLFAPIIENEKAQLKQYRDGDKDLLCLDWDQVGGELEIFGNFDVETEYQTFEYLVVPCNYVHAELGPTNDTIPDGCIADRKK